MPEKEHVRRTFRHILEQQPDIGVAKILSSWFFQPLNIFDPNARKRLKTEMIIALSYLALMAAVCAAFNLM
jgi:hypothetical protein